MIVYSKCSQKALVFILLIVSACAIRTPQAMQEQEPDYQYIGKSDNFSAVTECIFKKVDSYPVTFQLFDHEDRTIPVQMRQFPNDAELYQESSGGMIISLIKLEKLSGNEIQAKLYTGYSSTNGRVRDNYPELITSCFAAS